jgi:hypothetical protein
MIRLNKIERSPEASQVQAYPESASHFRAMAALAYAEGNKLTFEEMAKDMQEPADAVTVFAF